MWKKKSLSELAFERKQRKTKATYVFAVVFLFSVYWVINEYGNMKELAIAFKSNPEGVGSFLLLPLLLWVAYRGYVEHGTFGWTSQRVCVGCGRNWGHSNDGWGFMTFGKNKPKWYQVKVCNTPDKCDIVGRHEVVWVPEDETHNQ